LAVLFSLANINVKRGNTNKAAAYLKQIIAVDSNNFNAYKRLANLVDSSQLKLNYLKKANQLNAEDADVAFDLATTYKNNKDYNSAYQVLKVAIGSDTSNFILQQALLPVANQLEKYKEVIAIGEKLLQNGSDANIIKDVGKAYFFLKDYQKCINLYQLLEQLDIRNESIFYYMALSYRELKKYETAAAYGKKTIEEGISPNIASYYAMLGNVYEMDNKFKDALNAYKKGLTFNANPILYYRLGLLYDLKLKQKDYALKNYNLFIKSKLLKKSDLEQVNYAKLRIKDLMQVN
jgi:tetratricopeptide (TPR) repeat protein